MMPTKPLDHFDFARTFEAATFVIDLEDRGNDQRYAFLVSGWENLLAELARVMFPNGTDVQGLVAEIREIIEVPDAWAWATSSDMNPFRLVWAQSHERSVTILRLFQNEDERAVFQRNFPGGRRPGETDEEGAFDNAVSSGKEFRVASIEAIVELREVLADWDWRARPMPPEKVSRVTDDLDRILTGYFTRLPPVANVTEEEARSAYAQNTPNVIQSPTWLNGLPPEVAPLMIVRSLVRDYRAPLYGDCTSIQTLVSQYDHTGLFAGAKDLHRFLDP